MSKFEFVVDIRAEHGKSAARRMRRQQDRIPAVVYGAGEATQSISIQHKDIFHALEDGTVFSNILKLSIAGKEQQVILKAIQRHAYKPKILHVDFLRIKAKEHITMHVPLHFLGEEEAPGVKEGGVYAKNITDIEIRCLPAALPESIEVDVSEMALDQTIHLSDLKPPSGVEFAQFVVTELDEAHDHPVISLHVPKAAQADIEAEAREAEEAGEAAAESSEQAEKEADEKPVSEAKGEETDEGAE